jgi:hypothetical protein
MLSYLFTRRRPALVGKTVEAGEGGGAESFPRNHASNSMLLFLPAVQAGKAL